MVFWKIRKAFSDSREARKNAEAEFKRQLDAQTDATINEINRQTDAAIAQNQADHNAEMQKRHEQACAKVRDEIQTEFEEKAENIRATTLDLENDAKLKEMKDKIEQDIRWKKRYEDTIIRKKKTISRELDSNIKYFVFGKEMKLTSAWIYWTIPADIETDFEDKLQQLRDLASAKKQELGIEEEIVD